MIFRSPYPDVAIPDVPLAAYVLLTPSGWRTNPR